MFMTYRMGWLKSFLSTGGGRCVVCQNRLRADEEEICLSCMAALPYTRIKDHPENVLEKYFWEHIPVEKATCLFTYNRGSQSHRVLMELKYHNRPSLGRFFGRVMGRQLLETSFFDSVDMIVPIPLARQKLRKRGYNQAEMVACGLGEVTGKPVVTDAVKRIVANKTQTLLTRSERMSNVEGIFRVNHAGKYEGKHILLVDDVVTSGSTVISCASAFMESPGVRFSILALAMSASITEVPFYEETVDRELTNQEGEVRM